MSSSPFEQDLAEEKRRIKLLDGIWPRMLDRPRSVADLLFPPHCLVCGEPLYGTTYRRPLCGSCADEIRAIRPMCERCAMPLPLHWPIPTSHAAQPAGWPASCPQCRRRPLKLRSVIAVGPYTGRLQELVLRMKKASQEQLTLMMGELLAERLREAPLFSTPLTPERHFWWRSRERGMEPGPANRATLVAPVPMHWTRRWRRGVNQAHLLAEAVSRQLDLPCSPGLLQCVRKTQKQGTLSPQERRRNVRDAFRVSAGYAIQNRQVLLVDDVLTTGATANELARLLKRAGAAAVWLAVVARATGH